MNQQHASEDVGVERGRRSSLGGLCNNCPGGGLCGGEARNPGSFRGNFAVVVIGLGIHLSNWRPMPAENCTSRRKRDLGHGAYIESQERTEFGSSDVWTERTLHKVT